MAASPPDSPSVAKTPPSVCSVYRPGRGRGVWVMFVTSPSRPYPLQHAVRGRQTFDMGRRNDHVITLSYGVIDGRTTTTISRRNPEVDASGAREPAPSLRQLRHEVRADCWVLAAFSWGWLEPEVS